VRNFHFLLWAWMAVWAVFFIYQLSVASRVSKLGEEIERLKRQLKEG
jgi:hypothetical protein